MLQFLSFYPHRSHVNTLYEGKIYAIVQADWWSSNYIFSWWKYELYFNISNGACLSTIHASVWWPSPWLLWSPLCVWRWRFCRSIKGTNHILLLIKNLFLTVKPKQGKSVFTCTWIIPIPQQFFSNLHQQQHHQHHQHSSQLTNNLHETNIISTFTITIEPIVFSVKCVLTVSSSFDCQALFKLASFSS